MQMLYPRCAGLDVHKDTIVACVRCVSPPMHQEVRSFGTTTAQLLESADWLAEHDCTHVGTEATGIYWKPVWHGPQCGSRPATCARNSCASRPAAAPKAILAVAASMLTAMYYMLRDGAEYCDLGVDHFDRQDRSKAIRRLLKRLQDLGCDVPLPAHMA